MPDPRAKTRRRRHSRQPLTAAMLCLVVAACLVCLLVLLPPRRGNGGVETGPTGSSTPETAPGAPGSARLSSGAEESPAERPQPEERRPAGGEASFRTPAGSPPQRPERIGRLAVVIDDVGYSLENLEPFLRSELPLSLSVLPGLPHSAEAARRIQAAGKELLLHLPMEAQNGADPGPVAVLTTMSDEAVRQLLAVSLEEIPAVGVNNHMGSAATANERIMKAVLGYLKERGLFFLDSRTTGESVAPQVARSLSEPLLQRDVFLDNEPSAEDLAVQRGQAVLIGHVQNPQIVRLLTAALPELERRGVQLVRASDLIASGRE
jgi:polysaccharide deacetylase 2 family uncharacterized protein YibQ